jgi:hypothetical protein
MHGLISRFAMGQAARDGLGQPGATQWAGVGCLEPDSYPWS